MQGGQCSWTAPKCDDFTSSKIQTPTSSQIPNSISLPKKSQSPYRRMLTYTKDTSPHFVRNVTTHPYNIQTPDRQVLPCDSTRPCNVAKELVKHAASAIKQTRQGWKVCDQVKKMTTRHGMTSCFSIHRACVAGERIAAFSSKIC